MAGTEPGTAARPPRLMSVFECRDTGPRREASAAERGTRRATTQKPSSASASGGLPPKENKEPKVSPRLCDPRLQELNINRWTNVNIDNYMAAKCISLYLETDHPLLGHFDPELFVSHLTAGQGEFCSSLLVNALLYWACVGLPRGTADPDLFLLSLIVLLSAWLKPTPYKQPSLLGLFKSCRPPHPRDGIDTSTSNSVVSKCIVVSTLRRKVRQPASAQRQSGFGTMSAARTEIQSKPWPRPSF